MENKYKKVGIIISKLLFQYLLIFYLGMLLIREFKSNFLSILNLNYILIIVIVFGIITVLTYKPVKKEEIVTKNDYYLIFFLGVLGAILIYMKIKDLGYLAYLISIIAGILIVLLSKLVIEENGEE